MVTHEGADLVRSKKVAFWGRVEICGRICARGGARTGGRRDPIPFPRIRVQNTRDAHRDCRSAADQPAFDAPPG